MSRRRLSKQKLKSDRFVRQTFDWAHWAETHTKQLLAGAAVVVVLVAGFFLYRGSIQRADESASIDYLLARQAYFAGNFPLAVNDLTAFLAENERSSYADDARFFLARSLYEAGQYGQAIVILNDLLSGFGSSPFSTAGRRLLAASQMAEGDNEAAVETLVDAVDRAGDDIERIMILDELGRAYENLGRTDDAAAQYQAIIDLGSDNPAAGGARRRMSEITVRPIAGIGAENEAPEATEAP